jgi:hypothetical protein
MSYIAATHFDAKSWAKSGHNWLRKAKSAGLTGYVLGTDLPAEASEKAQELGFQVVPVSGATGTDLDRYHTLASVLTEGQRCLFTRPDVLPKGGLSEAKDVLCGTEKMANPTEIVNPIRSLYDRAKVMRLIGEKFTVTTHGILSPRSVLGTWDFWNGFYGFQSYLHERNYVDRRPPYDELMLNLYLAFVSFSLEIDNGSCTEAPGSAQEYPVLPQPSL